MPTSRERSTWMLRLTLLAAAALVVYQFTVRTAPTTRHRLPGGARLAALDLMPLVPADRPPPTLEQLRGKVVLVNFWGTWCGPCVAEFPHLVDLTQAYRGRDDFVFLSVSCGGGLPEDVEVLRRETADFLRTNGYELPVVADVAGKTRRALASFVPVDGYPLTVLIDRDGTIADFWQGYSPRGMEELKLRTATLVGK